MILKFVNYYMYYVFLKIIILGLVFENWNFFIFMLLIKNNKFMFSVFVIFDMRKY